MTNTKNILITILIISLLIVLTLYILEKNNNKTELKKLEKDNIELEKQKKLIDIEFNKVKKSLQEDSLKIVELNKQLIVLDNVIQIKNREITQVRRELSKIKISMDETKKNIKELKENPIKRHGDRLLESLKSKTKK